MNFGENPGKILGNQIVMLIGINSDNKIFICF